MKNCCRKYLQFTFIDIFLHDPICHESTMIVGSDYRFPTGPKSWDLKSVLESPRKSWDLLIFMKNPGEILEFYAISV